MNPLHRAWRALPAGPRRALFAGATAALAPRPARVPPPAASGLAICGETARASGIGEGARLMLEALAALNMPHWRVTPGDPAPALPPGAPLVLHVNPTLLPATLLRLPRGWASSRRLIGYWAWELPVTPLAWRRLARFVHELWVPSRFTAAALAPLLPGRIRIVPHPVGALPPCPAPRGRADFGLPENALVVLVSFSIASSFVRKNPLAAIAAFQTAFGTRPDRILVLKITDPDHAPDDMRILAERVAGADNIRLETRSLPRAENHALTRCADIVLSLHRSEGFGLVPAEAMALGRPVIATDWSATSEFLDAECGVPIPCTLIPARDPRGIYELPGAVWAEPSIPAAAAALTQLAEQPERRAALGAAAARAAASRLGTAPLSDALAALGLAP